MTVDCRYATDVDVEQFDQLLSANNFTERLTSLSIFNTPLTRLPASLCQLLNLQTLRVDRNRITELPDNCFTKLTKLMTLSMNHNSIVGLQDRLFDGLQSLRTLDLSFNNISSIGLRVFSNASDLIQLSSLDLSWNKLTSLEPWWYYRCIQASPTNVYLKWNLISNFTNKLEFNFRCGMKEPAGFLDFSYNKIIHIMDILDGWNIQHKTILTMMCLLNFQKSLSQQVKFSIAGYYYACDCVDFPVYRVAKLLPRMRILRDVYCATSEFRTDLAETVLAGTIPLNVFVCETLDRCPSNCRCAYRPSNNTLHVDCSAANLSSLPLDLPPLPNKFAKYKLDFSNNKLLRRLERRPYFVNTSFLVARNCSLTEISVDDLRNAARFSVADFRGNMLQSLPVHADGLNLSTRLLLGDNPWKCSCDHSWMIEWLQSLSNQILDPGDIICKTPARLYGRNVLKSTENDFCVDPVQRTLTITLSVVAPIFAVIVTMATTGLLMYKLREKCYRKWKFHPFDRDECTGEDMDYDVFLCCSSLDHRPHAVRILELIESNGYRVCYHERDFLPGSLITDNVGQSIQRSKRTVCLVSNNFLQR